MKKRFFILFLVGVFLVAGFTLGQPEVGKSPFGVSVTIVGEPNLEILSPQTGTYLTGDIEIVYISDADSLEYNLDSGPNLLLVPGTILNAAEGSHVLNVFATNQHGITQKSVNFDVDLSSSFAILYEEYKGVNKGESTDFYQFSQEQYTNFDNIIFENILYGKMEFQEAINLIQANSLIGGILDLDSYSDVSFNRIEIDTGVLQNFNKNAKLSFYNLDFQNPRILKDGSECPSNICTFESYSNGVLVFDVTEMGVFSAEEIVQPPPPNGGGSGGSGGGGGGGGGSSTRISGEEFYLDREEIGLSLNQGETRRLFFTIKNLEQKSLSVDFGVSPTLANLVLMEDKQISLFPREQRTIFVDFLAGQGLTPDLYVGRLVAKSKNTEKDILLIMEVESAETIFDVKATIEEPFLEIFPGEVVPVNITIFNLGDFGVDAFVNEEVRDKDSQIIWENSREIFVENPMISFIEEVEISEDVSTGIKIFYIKVNYQDKIASGSVVFNVKNKVNYTQILLILLILCLLVAIYYYIRHIKKKRIKRKRKKRKKS